MTKAYYVAYKVQGKKGIEQKIDVDGKIAVPERDQIVGLNGLRWKVLKVDIEQDGNFPRYIISLGEIA